MQCVVSQRQTRSLFLCVSFGAVFLWVVLGSYTNEPLTSSKQNAGLGSSAHRHLLSASSEDELKGSEPNCAEVELMKVSGGAVDLENDQCSVIHSLNTTYNSVECDFVECVDSCASDDGLINYLNFIYCKMPSKLIPLAMVVLFLWLIFLFIFLGTTAEEYFCPALTVISAILRLSQNVAGVTLLALGNGAPDIFSAFAAVNQDEDEKASLAVGALFGAGIFVTTIVVGAVTITKPVMLTQRPFLRDIIFYIFAVFWTFFLLWNNSMNIFNAVGFVALYVFYVIVVIVGRVVFQRWKRWRKGNKLGTGDMPRVPVAPDGKEMDHSDTSPITGLAGLGSLLPGVGVAGIYTPSPTANGHRVTVQVDVEEEEEETSGNRGNQEPPTFRITSADSSDFSASGGVVDRPIICIQTESESEGSPLFSRPNPNERRAKELAGASLPPLLSQQQQEQQDSLSSRRSGDSRGVKYGAIPVGIQNDSGSRSPSPTQRSKPLRKTISGALDVTEGVGAAFGIPHVPELWEEVSRGHHRNRSASYRSRSGSHRSQSGSHVNRSGNFASYAHKNAGETSYVSEEISDRTPLLGPTLTVPGTTERETEEEDENGSWPEEEDEETPVLRSRKKLHPFVKMILVFWPFGESFKELGVIGKIYEIAKSPAGILLSLTVPVIDTNEDNHNWNKWLNVLHCVTAPVFISLITKQGFYRIGDVFPVWTVVLIIGVLLAIIVACTSKDDRQPIYHCVFAWIGFIVAVVWIYSIANEIVNLLQAFGIVVKLSDGILGLTLLAWGNSIGDAVSNVTMSRQGFSRMAIGACFGGPLLNMLLGIGMASVVKSIRRRADGFKFPLIFTQVELIAALFLLASLVCTLITVSVLKFRLKRPYGMFLLGVYVVFLTVAILAEAKAFQINIKNVIHVE